MKNIKDIFKGSHRRFRVFFAITTAAFIFIWVVGPGNTVIHWIGAAVDIRNQERQIEQYKSDIEEMDERINLLCNDKDTLEKFAREQFHFAAPGEDVYVIKD